MKEEKESEFRVRISSTQATSEKVASTVATFLNEDEDWFQKLRKISNIY